VSILQSPETTIGFDIKYSNGSVISSTNYVVSRWMDQHTLDPVLMSVKNLQARSIGNRPQSNRSVTRSTDKVVTLRLHSGWIDVLWEVVFAEESNTLDDLFMSSKLCNLLLCVVIHINHLVVTGRCPNISIVLANGKSSNPVGVIRKGVFAKS